MRTKKPPPKCKIASLLLSESTDIESGLMNKKCYKCDSLWTAFSKKKLHVPIVLDGNFVNCALTGYVILVS